MSWCDVIVCEENGKLPVGEFFGGVDVDVEGCCMDNGRTMGGHWVDMWWMMDGVGVGMS